MGKPRVSSSVGLCQVEDGYLAFDARAGVLHELNPVGALIVELCDGTRAEDEIAELAAGAFAGEHPDEAVRQFIAAGLANGLLAERGRSTRAARWMDAEEIRSAGEELWQRDPSEAALKMARRYTELEPKDKWGWWTLGNRAYFLKRREVTIEAFRRYLELDPEDDSIRQILTGLEGGDPPARCSDRCITLIFDAFAANYDTRMLEDLQYQAPEQLDKALAAHLGERGKMEILDMGCGTGLTGALLKKRAKRLVGVDLSPAMVEKAKALGIYDAIEVGEIHAWLEATDAKFDLIASTECLIYVGDLKRVTKLAAKRLKPGGWLAYTVEKGEKYPLVLEGTGRYKHHRKHITEAAQAAGLKLVELRESFLRNEGAESVMGWVAVLRKGVKAA
jgi:predicted TPR repeat methyltransferase